MGRNISTVVLGVRLKPEVVAVYRRRAARQGRSLNAYMAFWLTDEAYRNHHRSRTETTEVNSLKEE